MVEIALLPLFTVEMKLAYDMANDLPKIRPHDEALDNRLRVINFEKVFVDNPTNQFEVRHNCKSADPFTSRTIDGCV